MADKKISALTGASTPLAGTEVLPIVQSGATVKVAVSNLTAGRAISATQITLTTGNVIIGTSGQGIDFSITSHPAGMTSELLADYEEGTWTPTQGAELTVVGTFGSSGTYTKIGRLVTVIGIITGSTSVASLAGGRFVGGLPYDLVTYGNGTAVNAGFTVSGGLAGPDGGTTIYSADSIGATTRISFTLTYFV